MPERTHIDTPIYVTKAELFKALAHPVRIRVLELLSTGEKTVRTLLGDVGIEASHLSQHLAVLRRNGVVAKSRQANTVTYSLRDPAISAMLEAAKTFLLHSLEETSKTLSDLTNTDTDTQTSEAEPTESRQEHTGTPQ